MKHFFFFCAVLLLAGCTNAEQRLRQRAEELCRYIPDHELHPEARDYMTADFYAVLDTMFHQLPEFEAMDHEWLYFFVTGNGGTIADYEVAEVKQTDASHAEATINVRQQWEDGSFDEETDIEQHVLSMERVDGRWLMSDFDGHKADCIRHIIVSRREQARRQAVSDYLIQEIGSLYLQGEWCIPALAFVRETDTCLWGDFRIYWYNSCGDTLLTVSGGNHAGMMTMTEENGQLRVTGFEQVEDGARFLTSAKRLFGEYYDIFQNINSNHEVCEAVRREQLGEYIRQHNLPFRYYKDYGWQAVEIGNR